MSQTQHRKYYNEIFVLCVDPRRQNDTNSVLWWNSAVLVSSIQIICIIPKLYMTVLPLLVPHSVIRLQ